MIQLYEDIIWKRYGQFLTGDITEEQFIYESDIS